MAHQHSNLTHRPAENQPVPSRADDVSNLLNAVQDLLIPFIRSADEDASTKRTGHGLSVEGGGPRTALVEHHKPHKLSQLMHLNLPQTGLAETGFLKEVEQILQYSVNTWDRGFMSELYASTDAPGLAAELILATLNTNVSTYEVSPALTLIEKHTTRALANLFGLNGPHAGGVSVPGGSDSNITSIVIARNTLYPETKAHGNTANNLKLVLFTSAHAHYSIAQAAQMLGFGSSSVRSVPVDPKTGSMDPTALSSLITQAKEEGHTPFYLNATAGTTVLGAYDPIVPLAAICKAHNLWLHIDATLGGPAIFSLTHAPKLSGSHHANTIAITPHNTLGVPLPCAFLLGADTRQFDASNTLHPLNTTSSSSPNPAPPHHHHRADSLKLHLSWTYHGTAGYGAQIDDAFATAAYLASLVVRERELVLVGENPPPGCVVGFWYVRGGGVKGVSGEKGNGEKGEKGEKEEKGEKGEKGNGENGVTREVVRGLVQRGFMVDCCADAGAGGIEFVRVVVGRGTGRGTVEGLVEAVLELGGKVGGGGSGGGGG